MKLLFYRLKFDLVIIGTGCWWKSLCEPAFITMVVICVKRDSVHRFLIEIWVESANCVGRFWDHTKGQTYK